MKKLPPLTATEAAKRLGVSVDMIYLLVKTGKLRAVRVAKTLQIPPAELERFYVAERTRLLELLQIVHQKVLVLYHRSEFDAMFLLLDSCRLVIEVLVVFKSTKKFSLYSLFLIQRNLDVFRSRHSHLWCHDLQTVVEILEESDYRV